MKSLRELADGTGAIRTTGDLSIAIRNIAYDSRLIEPGGLFVALRGGYFDGHDFIGGAIERGAVAVAAEREVSGVPSLVFADTRRALPRLAAAFYDWPGDGLGIIGITGTDGKTTTSYLTDAVLTHAGFRTGMVGTVAVKIAGSVHEHETRQTTPESLDIQRYLAAMRDAAVQWAILESTSHGLAAHRLDEITFSIAAVTNITHEHLEFHGSIDAYRRAKARLFERVAASGGWAVINLDDEGSRAMIDFASGARLVTYSRRGERASVLARDVECGSTGCSFIIDSDWGRQAFQTPYLGEFNVENTLCAVSIGLAAGIGQDQIAEAIEHAPAIPGRMVRVDGGQPFAVIVDYAHTPESIEKILRLLRRLSGDGRLICVSGSAGERDTTKRPMQGAVSAALADISIFTTEDPRFEDAEKIIEEIAVGAAEAGGVRGRDFHCIVDRQEALELAMGLARPGDTVVLAGKGHERSIIWGNEKRPWDEVEAARVALRRAGYWG